MQVKPFTDTPIKYLEYDGRPMGDVKDLGLSSDDYLRMYRWLVFARAVDDRCPALGEIEGHARRRLAAGRARRKERLRDGRSR